MMVKAHKDFQINKKLIKILEEVDNSHRKRGFPPVMFCIISEGKTHGNFQREAKLENTQLDQSIPVTIVSKLITKATKNVIKFFQKI